MSNQNQNPIKEEKVWLKVIKTGLMFEEFVSIAERKDPRLFEKASKEEVKKWQAGEVWEKAEPKPAEATTSKDDTDFKKILAEMQAKIEKLEAEKQTPVDTEPKKK